MALWEVLGANCWDLRDLSTLATPLNILWRRGALIINNSVARAQIVHSNGTDRVAFRDGLLISILGRTLGLALVELLAQL